MINITRGEYHAITRLMEIVDETKPGASEIISEAQASMKSIEEKQKAHNVYLRNHQAKRRARLKAEKEANK